MQSSDLTVALAGMKAWGRIGIGTESGVTFPETDGLTDWQRIEFDDSLLRFADAQVEKGNPEEATGIYLRNLARDEEHLQCAAIIGLAQIGTAKAVAAIFPKLRSDNNTVKLTARQAWERLASDEGTG